MSVDEDKAQNAVEEAADAASELDDSQISEERRWFFRAWLAGVFLFAVGVLFVLVRGGYIGLDIAFVGEVNLARPAEWLLTGLVALFLFVTLIAALVVAPGNYLEFLSRLLAGYERDGSQE